MSDIHKDFRDAYALAQRATDPEQRRILIAATGRALAALQGERELSEARQLLAFWRSMPEHITGSMAIRQLEDVLHGGMAPRSASAPKR